MSVSVSIGREKSFAPITLELHITTREEAEALRQVFGKNASCAGTQFGPGTEGFKTVSVVFSSAHNVLGHALGIEE